MAHIINLKNMKEYYCHDYSRVDMPKEHEKMKYQEKSH